MTEEKGFVGGVGEVAPVQDIAVSQVAFRTAHSLTAVRLKDVDDFLISKGTAGWSRMSTRDYAHSLRTFFHYAEQQGWCKRSIASNPFRRITLSNASAGPFGYLVRRSNNGTLPVLIQIAGNLNLFGPVPNYRFTGPAARISSEASNW